MCNAKTQQLLDSDLGTKVVDAVQAKIAANEPFTNACISHPIIETSKTVWHWQVKSIIAELWRQRVLVDADSVPYLRTLVNVYPNGQSNPSVQANLFYPDNGYDPYSFADVDRILDRSGDTDATITNTATGALVTKQCAVQTKEDTLNVPRFLIASVGWNPDENVDVVSSGGIVTVKKNSAGKQAVDKTGRLRLHGINANMFRDQNPVAAIVTPDNGDDYLQISAGNAIVADPVATSVTIPNTDLGAAAGTQPDADAGSAASCWPATAKV